MPVGVGFGEFLALTVLQAVRRTMVPGSGGVPKQPEKV
jgi:hypothetical protein